MGDGIVIGVYEELNPEVFARKLDAFRIYFHPYYGGTTCLRAEHGRQPDGSRTDDKDRVVCGRFGAADGVSTNAQGFYKG
ncbi:MAG: hypothetical protein NVS2B7_11180 [Herpetosiphon sp.]